MDKVNKAAQELLDTCNATIDALRSVKAREVLDRIGQASESQYMDIAVLAGLLCDMPIAAVSLIDDKTTFYKGLSYHEPLTEIDRSAVICNLVVNNPAEGLFIDDTRILSSKIIRL